MITKWSLVHIGDVADPVGRSEAPVPGKVYRQIGVRLWGQGAYEREILDGVQTKYQTLFRVENGDIVVNKIWARNGSVAVVTNELAGCYASGEFPIFSSNRNQLNPRWFHWITKASWFWRECDLKSRGTSGKNRIRPEKFLEIQIPLPSVEEQRRIVAKIDELARKIEEAHRFRHEATHEVQALLESASKVAFKPKSHWSEARVGDFCEMPQYGYTESATTEPVGPRFLRITDIQNGRVNWDNVPYCSCPNPQPYFLKENDILFARTGATTGKSFLIRDCPEAVFASYLIRLRVRSTVTPEYLYQYFQSPSYWTQVIEEKKGTGQPNVNGKKLANIQVPIPPLEEQRRIVEYLGGLTDKLEVLSGLQVNTTIELEALLSSILDKAFKGEL
jgi:type I restriction enzyme S subunit